MQKNRLLFLIFLSINAFTNFDIKISFEDKPKFKSQFEFIDEAKTIDSMASFSLLIDKQDWVEGYTLRKSPFLNSIEINIVSKKPLFILGLKNKSAFSDMSSLHLVYQICN